MTAKVILNPYSNRWSAKQRWPQVAAALNAAGVDFEVAESQYSGQVVELAEAAARAGFSPIIAAGGDGTIGEVANGLYRAQPDGVLGPLGVIPLGTANDLMHNLDLPLEIEAAAAAIAGGRTRRIDIGKANQWVFVNNSAVGLEPVVSQINIQLVKLKGVIRYLVAAVMAINRKPEWKMRIEWDEGDYDGLVSLVSVGNCAITGGLFRMAPDADPQDGKLTFVHAYAASRLKMYSLLPRAISGAYVNDPAVFQHHAKRFTIVTDPTTPFQCDGEVRSDALSQVTYEALEAKLDILVP